MSVSVGRGAGRPRSAGPRSAPTELEGCVLGILWERGPCTAYAVRRVFLDSPSPYWSGSAGAVYPLLARLEERGLARALESASGRRARRLFALTTRGRAGLARWLGPPLPDWIWGVPMDPLRTRVGFLGAIPAARRRRFLAESVRQVRRHLESSRAQLTGACAADPFAELVVRGALASLEARLAWLGDAQRRLGRRR